MEPTSPSIVPRSMSSASPRVTSAMANRSMLKGKITSRYPSWANRAAGMCGVSPNSVMFASSRPGLASANCANSASLCRPSGKITSAPASR